MRFLTGSRPTSQSPDDGFTLIELVVAMFVISFTLLGLITVQLQSLRGIGLAKERQQATALANRTIEQLRAMPYDTVTAGLHSCDLVGDGNVSPTTFAPTYDASISEPLITNTQPCTGGPVGPLYPHIQNGATTKLGKVQYRVRTYVSSASATVSKGYFLTVLVNWASGETNGLTKSMAIRSRLFSPAGCSSTSTATRPFAGPCQAFLYSDGGIAPAGITVTAVSEGSPLFTGIDALALEATLPSLSARTQNEQVVSTQSVTTTSEASVTTSSGRTTAGGQAGTSAADTDPATGMGNAPAAATSVAYSGATSLSASGSNGSFTSTVPSSAPGSAYSTTTASASPACPDDAGVALVTNQACSTGAVTPNGTYQATLNANIPGRNLGSFSLASIATPSTASTWRAFGARAALPVSGHCVGTSGIGCVASGARRTVGAMAAGGLPSASSGDTVPAGFTSMVTMDGFSATSYAESGLGAATPTVARTLTNLKYWNGSGYTPVTLTASAGGTFTLGSATGLYKVSGVPTLEFRLSGTLTVDPASSASTGTSPCQSAACSVTSKVGTVRASIQYDVTLGGVPLASFVVTSNLGSTIAQTSYKAAPSA